MPRLPSLFRCAGLLETPSITSSPLLDFLIPNLQRAASSRSKRRRDVHTSTKRSGRPGSSIAPLQEHFFHALARASVCQLHKSRPPSQKKRPTPRAYFSTSAAAKQDGKRPGKEYPEAMTLSELGAYLDGTKSLDGQPDPGGTRIRQRRLRGLLGSPPTQNFAAASHLPNDFFIDIYNLQNKVQRLGTELDQAQTRVTAERRVEETSLDLPAQMRLLQSVRDLENKLAQARADLKASVAQKSSPRNTLREKDDRSPMILTKEDYKGLVDLYFYTQLRRSEPDAPDHSPTPILLDEYAFKLSDDFATPDAFAKYYTGEEGYVSPLKEIEEALKSRKIREITVMQEFVDLLLDNTSSNGALYEVYQKLPSPGVAYLPHGVLRLFLQRMSTPWARSGKSMLRYLSLIDDMQRAKLPITRSEWSSAIYAAGRSFGKVTSGDMKAAFHLWRQMEQEAGVTSHHVTFNILFDIAVRAGKYPIAQSMLKEMYNRGLKLNRLGRVSLIYYHGLRRDGDAIRKAYRDFVDAGEIVDTLVLNCVIAALMMAQEPSAAEQTYERMKDLQKRFEQRQRPDGSETLYLRYPPGGETTIDRDLASNALGRILLNAPRLRSRLPEHHTELQNIMPLTPNHSTFRSMISYHANVSGDLNRLTVLMNEMSEVFHLPFQSVNFQLLFKGFALHGRMRDPDCTWNLHRLDMVWDACRNAIKDAEAARKAAKQDNDIPKPTLSSVKEVEAADLSSEKLVTKGLPSIKKLSTWDDFVIDLAVFPRERKKDIERVHAQLFDEEAEMKRFRNPFFQHSQPSSPPENQGTYYPLGGGYSSLDNDEGEYTLPSPAESIAPKDPTSTRYEGADYRRAEQFTNSGNEDNERAADSSDEDEKHGQPHDIRATRPLVCWLLRAYARCSGSRYKVEEVWNSARKVWRPSDDFDKQSVYRVLRRCLRDCDRYGGHTL